MNLFFCSQLGKCSDQPGSALWLWWTASGGPCYISARMKSMRNPAVIVGMITLQKKSWSHRSCLGSSKDVRIYIVYVYIYIYTLNIYYVYIYYIILYSIILYYYIILFYIILYYIILHYIILYYIILYYIIYINYIYIYNYSKLF